MGGFSFLSPFAISKGIFLVDFAFFPVYFFSIDVDTIQLGGQGLTEGITRGTRAW